MPELEISTEMARSPALILRCTNPAPTRAATPCFTAFSTSG